VFLIETREEIELSILTKMKFMGLADEVEVSFFFLEQQINQIRKKSIEIYFFLSKVSRLSQAQLQLVRGV
jgi:hypothetical protein